MRVPHSILTIAVIHTRTAWTRTQALSVPWLGIIKASKLHEVTGYFDIGSKTTFQFLTSDMSELCYVSSFTGNQLKAGMREIS